MTTNIQYDGQLTKATEGAGAYDLHATDGVLLKAHSVSTINTGVYLNLPDTHIAWVIPRSGLAARHLVSVANSPGLIDSDYRGEVMVALENRSDVQYQVHEGDRIAQLTFERKPDIALLPSERHLFSRTARGDGGFGSTGIQAALDSIKESMVTSVADSMRGSSPTTQRVLQLAHEANMSFDLYSRIDALIDDEQKSTEILDIFVTWIREQGMKGRP